MRAYVITLHHNANSLAAAHNCLQSARRQGFEVDYFEASTGKDGGELLQREGISPVTVKGTASQALIRHQKQWVVQPGVIGCYASHYRLWQLSVQLQEPIAIFEHDALILTPFPPVDWQDVLHMGCEGQLTRRSAKWARLDKLEVGSGVYRMGFRPSELPELVCMSGTHAYAIKPHAAQALINDAQTHGWFAVDRAMREPVVMIETHNPSLATLQAEYMRLSTTTSTRWKIMHALRNGMAGLQRALGVALGDGARLQVGLSRQGSTSQGKPQAPDSSTVAGDVAKE